MARSQLYKNYNSSGKEETRLKRKLRQLRDFFKWRSKFSGFHKWRGFGGLLNVSDRSASVLEGLHLLFPQRP